jgi:glycine cleavage system H protein
MSHNAPCLYSDSHEWFRLDGETITIGLTQFAANELTDITYVEMKPAGSQIGDGDSVGEVESVKTTSDVYSAYSGEIVEVNGAVESDPGLINSDPQGAGWLIKIKTADPSAATDLMDEATYHGKYPV